MKGLILQQMATFSKGATSFRQLDVLPTNKNIFNVGKRA